MLEYNHDNITVYNMNIKYKWQSISTGDHTSQFPGMGTRWELKFQSDWLQNKETEKRLLMTQIMVSDINDLREGKTFRAVEFARARRLEQSN